MHLQPSAMVILKIGGALVVQKQIKTHSRYLECVFVVTPTGFKIKKYFAIKRNYF
jgi:hypothetical protein